MVANNVVRMWMVMSVEYQTVAQEVLGLNVGICLLVFYANYGMVGARYSE